MSTSGDDALQGAGDRGAWSVVTEHVGDITAALQASLHALDSEVNPDKVRSSIACPIIILALEPLLFTSFMNTESARPASDTNRGVISCSMYPRSQGNDYVRALLNVLRKLRRASKNLNNIWPHSRPTATGC